MKQRIFGLLAAVVACLCALAFSACSLIGLQGEKENLLLQRNGDRTGYIVTGMKEERAEITVPASYNGLPVLAFGEGAFRNNKILRSVSFAAGSRVEAVSSGAFEGCANLQTIRLPDTVTAIGSRAFMYCTLLTRFTLPAGLEEVGVDAFAGDYRLAEVYNLSSLDLADSALAQSGIGRYARVVHTSADAESCLQTDAEGFLLFANAAEGDYCVLGYTGGNKTPLSLPASVAGTATLSRRMPSAAASGGPNSPFRRRSRRSASAPFRTRSCRPPYSRERTAGISTATAKRSRPSPLPSVRDMRSHSIL